MDDCCAGKGKELERVARHKDQRRVLVTVLALNAAMFVVEFGGGVIAGSASLMADSVDMLGDALVYSLSLNALNRGPRWLTGAAVSKGGFIFLFGIGVLVEVYLKIVTGVPPSSTLMLEIGGLALVANLTCLALLWRYREQDLNMLSTFECSRNDVIANLGVLAAAGAVMLFQSAWPDILVGLAIAALVLRSAYRVLKEAWPAFRSHQAVHSR